MPLNRPPDRAIPAETTTLVGRDRELAHARHLLARTRLLTVTGPAGIGKTRLALRTARDLHPSYPHGAHLVDLALLQDGDRLAQTITRALAVSHEAPLDPLTRLVRHLTDQQLLLVLDNCEHLTQHCAPLIRTLLVAAPGVRVLATSRHQLGVYGEHILDLPPLATPDPDRPPTPTDTAGYAAVQLFVQRAQAVDSGFPHSAEEWTATGRVCARLDGLPLAIELAASWTRVLPVQQILDRIDSCPHLPAPTGREVPPRHRTLHAAIESSYHLCTTRERDLWTALSVFSAGFDLAAAEAVGPTRDLPRHAVLPTLAALVDKSLLTREHRPGDPRYRMLETLRHFGLARLREQGREPDTRRRHRDHYRHLAAAAEADWFSPRQHTWFARLRHDHANLRSAVEFGLTSPAEAESALDMVASLWSHRLGHGGLEEERHWLRRTLALATTPTPARAKALWADGWLALLRGDTPTATDRLTECRTIAEHLDHRPTRALTDQLAGLDALFHDDFDRAAALLERSLDHHPAADDPGARWTTLFLLAVACTMDQDPRARTYAEQSLALCETHQAQWSRRYALWLIGLQRHFAADLDGARAVLQDALRAEEPGHNLFATAQTLEVLAWTAAQAGAATDGATLLGAAQALWERIGIVPPALGRLLNHRAACEDRLRRHLGEERLADALRAGTELSLAQAVAFALDRKPFPGAEADSGHPVLTAREQQVVDHLVEGLTDKQIAARLVLSPRTVEGHIQRILAKLHLTSRLQIATWACGRRAAPR
ncbi:ATP-binding protein [Kitasatospora camelliae]|uniref:LuxR C-terminal-related transcriptional regulator n=1 Tax=Kitasatospora camelliae TaxID=3156397 RepID=A0AAU8K5U0_9ACTN